MADRVPLYTMSSKEAQRLGEHGLWLDSYQENCACARRIELAIKDAYATNRLNEACAKDIIKIYGFDRVNWVLAHTVQRGDNDTRFSEESHAWAKEYRIPYDDHYLQRNFTVGVHPTLVETFVDYVRKLWRDLGLYDKTHCYDESRNALDYTGKIVVVSPKILSDEDKKPDNQLFLVIGGNGCRPLATEITVLGIYLKDRKRKTVLRGEIIGVIKLELLPEWARQRFLEIAIQDGESDENNEGEIPE